MKKATKAAKAAKQNPITSFFGLLAIAAALAPVWAPPKFSEKIQQSAIVLAGGGLLASADGRRKE
jgi:hypothetical protein